MTKTRPPVSSAVATMRAARSFTRRTLLKSTIAAGGLAALSPALGPWVVQDARSSSCTGMTNCPIR